jgi:predicted ATP-dependent protease
MSCRLEEPYLVITRRIEGNKLRLIQSKNSLKQFRSSINQQERNKQLLKRLEQLRKFKEEHEIKKDNQKNKLKEFNEIFTDIAVMVSKRNRRLLQTFTKTSIVMTTSMSPFRTFCIHPSNLGNTSRNIFSVRTSPGGQRRKIKKTTL